MFVAAGSLDDDDAIAVEVDYGAGLRRPHGHRSRGLTVEGADAALHTLIGRVGMARASATR